MCGIMCHYYTDIIINLDVSANLTNGVTVVVNTAPDGELLSIRVTWRIKSEYLGCRFTTLKVELYISGPEAEVGKDISVSDETADFFNEQLNCNTLYMPRVRVVYVNVYTVTVTDNGIPVIYGGKSNYSHHPFVLYDCMGT